MSIYIDGDTYDEVRNALHFKVPLEKIAHQLGVIVTDLRASLDLAESLDFRPRDIEPKTRQ